ncbi:VOC family protein [Paracoccus jiaweipingae]|uniref:glyoxalase n=1 Tax=unclassified Paracoccus (in: a-proteobacteria) TaxID=2688777 RepID=UPI0037B90E9E
MDLIMDHGFIVTLGAGEQRTQLSMAREGGAGTDLPCLSVEVDDLDPVVARAGDAVCYGPVTEDWGVRRVFLRDPEGNLVNILQHL